MLLQTLLQSYQNVSNSQLFRRCSILPKGCKRFCKVIKILAIPNVKMLIMNNDGLQTLLRCYQNVSNLQLCCLSYNQKTSCKRFCKVIKMLAIHNCKFFLLHNLKLQTLLQSYQNVSNSQRSLSSHCTNISCKRFCKVIKMLAIHNLKARGL